MSHLLTTHSPTCIPPTPFPYLPWTQAQIIFFKQVFLLSLITHPDTLRIKLLFKRWQMFAFNIDGFEKILPCPLIFPPHDCFLQYQVAQRMVTDKREKMPDDFSFLRSREEDHISCNTDLLQAAKCPLIGTHGNLVRRNPVKPSPDTTGHKQKKKKKKNANTCVCVYVCINIHTMSSLNSDKVCTPSPLWLARARVPEE